MGFGFLDQAAEEGPADLNLNSFVWYDFSAWNLLLGIGAFDQVHLELRIQESAFKSVIPFVIKARLYNGETGKIEKTYEDRTVSIGSAKRTSLDYDLGLPWLASDRRRFHFEIYNTKGELLNKVKDLTFPPRGELQSTSEFDIPAK